MEEKQVFNNDLESPTGRRRDLLPRWIKFFVWVFMIFGALAPISFVCGIIGMDFELSLYGFETMEPFSLIGLMIVALFIIKGVTAFGPLDRKRLGCAASNS